MMQVFRMEVITLLHKKKIISDDVATNLASWKNSGFNVHASDPFLPHVGNTLKNRLAYAFRPPACLARIQYNETSVTYETKKGVTLNFTPIEFLSKLTLHIPDHYQNVRLYLGFYSSHVRRKIVKASTSIIEVVTEPQAKQGSSNWASCISRIYKNLSINCPNCSTPMELVCFILHVELFIIHFPELSRAPPLKGFSVISTESISVDYSFFDCLIFLKKNTLTRFVYSKIKIIEYFF